MQFQKLFLGCLFWACVVVSLEGRAGAGDGARLNALFTDRFFTAYESGQCGKNVMGLLNEAHRHEVDVASARILKITNEGNTVFGMVNAELARGGRHVRHGTQRPVEESNWYHHIVLEMDCMVYDFDYLNAPTVTPLQGYLENMFLNEHPRGKFPVGRDVKLRDYRVKIYNAPDYFANPARPAAGGSLWLSGLLQECR